MGKPMHWKSACCYAVGYSMREPCEVKHLSSTWKRNQAPQGARDSVSSGERKRIYIEIYSLGKYSSVQRINYLLAQTYLVSICSNASFKAYRRCWVGVISGSYWGAVMPLGKLCAV